MKLINESSKTKIVNNFLIGILAIYGISQKRFNLDEPTLFQKIMTEVISPVQEGLASSKKNISSLWDNYILIVNTGEENAILKKQISRLKSDIFSMEEVRKENLRLKQLLNYSDDIAPERILAQVVGWDSPMSLRLLDLTRGRITELGSCPQ